MKIVELGSVATIERKGVDPRAVDPETLYIGLEHIERGGRIIGHDTVAGAELASAKFQFSPEHVLFGKLRPNLGKVSRPQFAGVCSTDILPIRPGNNLDRNYLAHYLAQPSMVEFAASRASGANLPRSSPTVLATFPVPLPTLAEQRRIAAILDHADFLRAQRRQVLAHLDDLIGAIFHDMFSGGGFEIVTLKEAIRWSSGKFLPAKEQKPGAHRVYGGNGVNGVHDDYMFEVPRLVVGRVGAYCGAVHLTKPFSWVTDNALVATLVRDDLTLDYLLPALTLANLNQYAGVSGQPSISAGKIGDVPLPIPPPDLQRSFADRVARVRVQADLTRAAASSDSDLFAALQSRAFRGEL